jgi:hypothetical protein
MPTYKKTNITSKIGVNFIKDIVERSGSIFHKIEQENDLGIDAIIEFIKDEKPTHKSIAIQIKSGMSFFNKKTNECIIPVKSHYDYWNNYPLPVYGIVYVPEKEKAYWIDIKQYFRTNCKTSQIKFEINRLNIFDLKNFNNYFTPLNSSELPIVSIDEALSLFESENIDEFLLGSQILFKQHVNNEKTWYKFIDYIKTNEIDKIPLHLIYYLAHIPWHPDIYHTGEIINEDTRRIVIKIIQEFDKTIVIKLLSMIDEEEGIQRGTIGQSIEAILSKVTNIEQYLEEIILDKLDISIKYPAIIIYAYYKKEKSLPILKKLNSNELDFIEDIIQYIDKNKSFDIY